ncbi:MAG: phosphatidylinositol-4-phosphate 5-kinase, partial [Candidatus Electrothrix sp. AR5]|nr:phosphatidylinositol-4-phosphate 5-kinase [Candidatus Electrothrix sp. AR5]
MGTYFDPNGGSFEGEWKNGMRNGRGCIEWSGRYYGDWKDNLRHGQGTWTM